MMRTGVGVTVAVFALLGILGEGLADDGEVIRSWNDALRRGENPAAVDTRHLVEVERHRDGLKVRYLDPSRAEEVEEGRWQFSWVLLSGVAMVGEPAMARVETEYLCEEGLERGLGAMVFDVRGRLLRQQQLPEEWIGVEESDKPLLEQFCRK